MGNSFFSCSLFFPLSISISNLRNVMGFGIFHYLGIEDWDYNRLHVKRALDHTFNFGSCLSTIISPLDQKWSIDEYWMSKEIWQNTQKTKFVFTHLDTYAIKCIRFILVCTFYKNLTCMMIHFLREPLYSEWVEWWRTRFFVVSLMNNLTCGIISLRLKLKSQSINFNQNWCLINRSDAQYGLKGYFMNT